MDPAVMGLVLAFGILAGITAVGGPWHRPFLMFPENLTGRAWGTAASVGLGLMFSIAGWHQQTLSEQVTAETLDTLGGEVDTLGDALTTLGNELDTARDQRADAFLEAERIRLERRRLRVALANSEADLARNKAMFGVGMEERLRLANAVGAAILSRDEAQARAGKAETDNAKLVETLESADSALSGADARLLAIEGEHSRQARALAALRSEKEHLAGSLTVTEAALAESQAFEDTAQAKVAQLRQTVEALEADLTRANAATEQAKDKTGPGQEVSVQGLEASSAPPVEIAEIAAPVTDSIRPLEPRWISLATEPEGNIGVQNNLGGSATPGTEMSREVTFDTARRMIERTLLEDPRARGRYVAAISLGQSRFEAILTAQGDDESARRAIRAFGDQRTQAIIIQMGG